MSFFRTPQNTPFKSKVLTSTPSEPKIMKITPGAFEFTDVFKAIMGSLSLSVVKFDSAKHDAKTWLGLLENAIVSVGGVTETHGTGVLAMLLNKEDSKWHLKFTLTNPDATWTVCKQKFIAEFDDTSSKQLYSIFDRKKSEKKIELWSKFFPSLSSSDLNLIALAGLDQKSIKALKLHKSTEKETFTELCDYYSTLNNPEFT